MVQGAPHSGLHRRRRLNPSALTDLKHHRGPQRLTCPAGCPGIRPALTDTGGAALHYRSEPAKTAALPQHLRRAIVSDSDTAAGQIRTRLRIWLNLDTTARFHIKPCKVRILAQT